LCFLAVNIENFELLNYNMEKQDDFEQTEERSRFS